MLMYTVNNMLRWVNRTVAKPHFVKKGQVKHEELRYLSQTSLFQGKKEKLKFPLPITLNYES